MMLMFDEGAKGCFTKPDMLQYTHRMAEALACFDVDGDEDWKQTELRKVGYSKSLAYSLGFPTRGFG